MNVSVLDKNGKPLMPCSEKRARLLLERGRTRAIRRTLFQIKFWDSTQEESVLQPIISKIDLGSKASGLEY
jgi:RRXRR protein